jgi:hypothetical protein
MNRRRNAEYEIKMNKTKISIGLLTLLSFVSNFTVARDRGDDENYHCRGGHCLSAPEIDPGQALGALTLLAGAVAIVRGYRRKK